MVTKADNNNYNNRKLDNAPETARKVKKGTKNRVRNCTGL